jgi:hypothetical protein
MLKRSLLITVMLLFSVCAAPAQTPADATAAAARDLVTTMKLEQQFKAVLPIILRGLKPALVQNRPEVERDFDAMIPMMMEAFTPYYSAIVDGITAVYASNFTAEELRDIEAFYRQPAGQKMLEKMPTIAQQSMQVGQLFGQKAGEVLRERMTEELRKRGHKI